MRKLKLQMQLTLDGFVAGPNGEMDWMNHNWDDELNQYVGKITEPVDGILLGRKLAEGFIPYWTAVAEDPKNPENEAGKFFRDTQKIVFSNTFAISPWENTVVASGDLAAKVAQLKAEEGGDLIVYGGGSLVSSLIRANLIDTYYLMISPVAIGKGMTVFASLEKQFDLVLIESRSFACGINLLCYAPKQ